MMKTCIFLWFLCFTMATVAQRDYSMLVNPFIGTGGHGHTFPGATMPFGMVQLSPDTRMDDWDGSSGYHYSDSVIYGFSHTHLNGTGVPDYCDILFQPYTGEDKWATEEFRSAFSHTSEKASAGLYSVHLDKHNIDVSLTATLRTGLHQYAYPAGTKEGKVLVDLEHRDKVLETYFELVDSFTIKGYRFSQSWAKNQKLYFAARFSKPIIHSVYKIHDVQPNNRYMRKMAFTFDVTDGQPVLCQVAISPVDMNGALNNLDKEHTGFDFDGTVQKAKTAWNRELGKIEVFGGTNDQQTVFYSALYRRWPFSRYRRQNTRK
jgi:predicted alpha-1,2-mannosidase